MLKIKKKVNKAFPQHLDKEKVEALFAQLINKFGSESEGLIDHCTRLSVEGDILTAAKQVFTLEWEDSGALYQILDQVNQVISFYSELFANKTNAVVFSKKLLLRIYATIYEQFTWVVKNCFHKRNAFKHFVPNLLHLEQQSMKRRSDTKAFLTAKATFVRLVSADTECFQNFLQNVNFYVPKSNQVCLIADFV